MTGGAHPPVRVGVLGTGAISQVVHLPILSERTDVDLVAVSDDDDHKAATLAERFGVERVLTGSELVEDDGIEAVFVCTPNHLHETQAVAVLEAGKHLLVERPMALDAEGAQRVLDAALEADRSVVVGMSHRFRPDVAALRALVAGGELGDVYSISGSWLNRRIPAQKTTWRQKPEEAGGGALMDLGVQALDLCLWLVDYPPAVRVRTMVHGPDPEVEESATVMVELDGGMSLTVEVSWSYFAAEDRHSARVLGSDGSASLPPLEVFRQLGGRPLDVTPRQPRPQGGENPFTNAYRREIDHFLRSVRGEIDHEVPRNQPALMGLVRAAYRSAREGREVEV